MVSEETIRALVGHIDKKMLEVYSHIRTKPKYDAIRALEQQRVTEGAQKGAQLEITPEDVVRKVM
jgi:hypothetical protein